MISYNRRFIKIFATVSPPLIEMVKGKRSKYNILKWTIHNEEAFKKLKTLLVNSTYLTTPNFGNKFKIYCDASSVAVLMQDDENYIEKPLAFASRKLRCPETNYDASELECLGMVFACEKCRPFMDFTNHGALIWLF